MHIHVAISHFISWSTRLRFTFLYLTLLGIALTNNTVLAFNAAASIEIESDTAVIEEGNRSHTYMGQVVLKQDGLLLQAEKLLVLFNDAKQVTELTASGQEDSTQAYLKRRLEPNDTWVEAWAGQINYNLSDNVMNMTNNVLMIQDNNQFKGETLLYNLDNGSINANTQLNEGGRVQVIIQP